MSVSYRVRPFLGLALFSLLGCGDDAPSPSGNPGAGPGPACSSECTAGDAPACSGEGAARECALVDGCWKWRTTACAEGSRCSEGQCVACAGGCCPSCAPNACGPGSNDGCGGSCGDAVYAEDAVDALATTYCQVANPCCDDPGVICSWISLAGCKQNFISTFLSVDTPVWCSPAIEQCRKALDQSTCASILDVGPPAACDILMEKFDVAPAVGACPNAGEIRCGPLGECTALGTLENCGSCYDRCSETEACSAGACTTCGGEGQPCCGSTCSVGSCTDGVCVQRACEKPISKTPTHPYRCDYDCYLDCDSNLAFDCMEQCMVNNGHSYAAKECSSCLQEMDLYCSGGGDCKDEVQAYRCCTEDCAGNSACISACEPLRTAYQTCAKSRGCVWYTSSAAAYACYVP